LLQRGRYRLVGVGLAFYLALSFATRVVLLFVHLAGADDWPWLSLPRILLTGTMIDLVVGLWVVLPWVLLLSVLPARFFERAWGRALLLGVAGLAIYGMLFAAAAEGFFFEEFDGRFNFVAVDYLVYPTEVVTNIWQSYPTGWILAGLGLATLALLARLRTEFRALPAEPLRLGQRGVWVVGYGVVLALATWILPANAANFSGSRALDDLANNGYRTFVLALLGTDAPYEGLYAEAPAAQVFHRLRNLITPDDPESRLGDDGTTRHFVHSAGPERRMNVVVVLEESFGSEFLGKVTPSFDQLARQGAFFSRAMSTGNRTIRALEATTSSLPPLPGVSIVRRSRSRGLFTLPEVLRERGYQTLFVYGGRALFDGMGSYLTANGVDRVVDQSDYPDDAFRTAWGVADEVIFDRALVEMDQMRATGRPFYSLILTTSNHRPFTFPEGAIRRDPKLKGRENAVRYADWALGEFIRKARQHEFFDDTLFVLMGDHGARVYGAAEIPLESYRVPMLFLAPRTIAAREVPTLASSLDVPPTVLGLLGFDYESKFFGRDLFANPADSGRALMTHNNAIALLRDDRLAVLGLRRSTQLFECREAPAAETAGDLDCSRAIPVDAAGQELIDDAIALYSGADRVYRSGAYAFDDAATVPGGL
jgi:phosphoglycerol transferase MdoB-like AlkP superfamily enzyme